MFVAELKPVVGPGEIEAGATVGTDRDQPFADTDQGLAERILRNFDLAATDSALVISSSGCNVVPIEIAEQFQKRGVRVVSIVSAAHSEASTSRHPGGKKLQDFSDLVLDTGAGYELHTNRFWSVMSVLGGVVLTALFWAWLLLR